MANDPLALRKFILFNNERGKFLKDSGETPLEPRGRRSSGLQWSDTLDETYPLTYDEVLNIGHWLNSFKNELDLKELHVIEGFPETLTFDEVERRVKHDNTATLAYIVANSDIPTPEEILKRVGRSASRETFNMPCITIPFENEVIIAYDYRGRTEFFTGMNEENGAIFWSKERESALRMAAETAPELLRTVAKIDHCRPDYLKILPADPIRLVNPPEEKKYFIYDVHKEQYYYGVHIKELGSNKVEVWGKERRFADEMSFKEARAIVSDFELTGLPTAEFLAIAPVVPNPDAPKFYIYIMERREFFVSYESRAGNGSIVKWNSNSEEATPLFVDQANEYLDILRKTTYKNTGFTLMLIPANKLSGRPEEYVLKAVDKLPTEARFLKPGEEKEVLATWPPPESNLFVGRKDEDGQYKMETVPMNKDVLQLGRTHLWPNDPPQITFSPVAEKSGDVTIANVTIIRVLDGFAIEHKAGKRWVRSENELVAVLFAALREAAGEMAEGEIINLFSHFVKVGK